MIKMRGTKIQKVKMFFLFYNILLIIFYLQIVGKSLGSATQFFFLFQSQMACGGLYHTITLSNHGTLHSFGCNDEGQLGFRSQ